MGATRRDAAVCWQQQQKQGVWSGVEQRLLQWSSQTCVCECVNALLVW